MQIRNHSVVSFHYDLTDEQGQLVESSRDGVPSLYLHGGYGNIIPGLEREMAGHQTGDSFTATLEPHNAYGPYKDELKDRVPMKYLKHEGKIKPGQIVRISSDNGVMSATVIKVGRFSADCDFNHPLAGKTATFTIDIVDVRDASAEEIDHGHAHGAGGHQH